MTDEAANLAFARSRMIDAMAPPRAATGAIGWLRKQLFNNWLSAVLTLVGLGLVWLIVPPLIKFLVIDAVWDGAGRDDCLPEKLGRPVGACWPFIQAKFAQLVYGFYPPDEYWRPNLVFILGAALLANLLIPQLPYKGATAVLFFGVFPIVAFFLLVGGVFGLEHVETRVGRPAGHAGGRGDRYRRVAAAGIMLALGRRSHCPSFASSVIFIEFWRGVPLITVCSSPPTCCLCSCRRTGASTRCCARWSAWRCLGGPYGGVVRGGLQAIPRALRRRDGLGIGYWKMTGLIVLPQALKLVIPGIVNTFIGLFKDTTLVMIVAIFDFLGQLRAAFADPNWSTPSTLFTGFAFAGIVYFIFCFAMSRYSLFVERRLDTGYRR